MVKKHAVNVKDGMRALTKSAEIAADSRFGSDDKFTRAAAIVATTPSGVAHRDFAPGSVQAVGESTHANDTCWVPISKIRDNPRNARRFYDPAKVNERAASIAKEGQITAAPACLDWENPGGYILIGGHYRKKALLQLGRTEIQIKLLTATNNWDLYRLSYAENAERAEGTPLDDAVSWKELLTTGEFADVSKLSEALGVARSTVSKTLQLLDLPSSVLNVLTETPDRFGLTAAYTLTQMTNVDVSKLEDLARRIATGELTTRALDELRKDILPMEPTTRKTKEISRQHKILVEGELVGHIKDWDSGKVVLEVTINEPAKRQQLVEELRHRFGLDAQ